jgi:thioesterase domain-containing protein
MVMLEVAQQLKAAGETVELLALVDAYAPEAITPQPKVPLGSIASINSLIVVASGSRKLPTTMAQVKGGALHTAVE